MLHYISNMKHNNIYSVIAKSGMKGNGSAYTTSQEVVVYEELYTAHIRSVCNVCYQHTAPVERVEY